MRFLLFTVSPASQAALAASSQKDKRSASAANTRQREEQGPEQAAGWDTTSLWHHQDVQPAQAASWIFTLRPHSRHLLQCWGLL